MNWSYYSTLLEAKTAHKTPATQTADDDVLVTLIRQTSMRIDQMVDPYRRRPAFMPMVDTRYFPLESYRVNWYDNTFYIGDSPLLALTAVSVTSRNSETVITSSVEAYPGDERNIRHLLYTDTSRTWYDNATDTPPYQVKVTGVWGYHPDYAYAWRSETTLAADITDSDTSFDVASASGLSVGHLLRIGTEYIGVTAISTNTLTVERAVNGSTASAHTTGAAVQIWQTDDRIVRSVSRQTGLMYARRGAYQVETLDGVGVITYPQDWLTEAKTIVMEVMNGI